MQASADRGQLTVQLDANMIDKYALKVSTHCGKCNVIV